MLVSASDCAISIKAGAAGDDCRRSSTAKPIRRDTRATGAGIRSAGQDRAATLLGSYLCNKPLAQAKAIGI